jgi:carboxyl-terminal processing protease
MLNQNTGFLRIDQFSVPTYDEFMDAAETLLNQGMNKLVLDLRGNPGGVMESAIQIADEFLPKGDIILSTKSKNQAADVARAESGGRLENVRLVVLIDENSASAAEILAGALQDNDRGVLIGRRTYGKGLVQQDQILRDGSSVRMTVSRYYMPSGRSIQRSYSGDYDAYMRDEARYIKGELFSKDSMYLDKTKTYKTKNGRKVFGGGGVVPDEFVPLDTAGSSFYLTALNVNQVFSAYVFKSLQFNRGKWKTARSLGAYAFTSADLEAFTGFAYKTYKISGYEILSKPARARITQQLKVEFARQLWDETGVYQVNVLEDKELQLALRKLN